MLPVVRGRGWGDGVEAIDVRPVTLPAPGGPRRLLRTLLTGPATPDRLRRVGAVLVLGCLLFAVVSALSGASRTEAVQDAGSPARGAQRRRRPALPVAGRRRRHGHQRVRRRRAGAGGRAQPLRRRHRPGGRPAGAGRRPAADRRSRAATRSRRIAGRLPDYTGLIETARVYNRQGLPLGQSYLDSGSQLMREEILPAAEQLRRLQVAALEADYQRGEVLPVRGAADRGRPRWPRSSTSHVVERRRTNRVLNLGLLLSGVALAAALLWWAVALLVAGAHLGDGRAAQRRRGRAGRGPRGGAAGAQQREPGAGRPQRRQHLRRGLLRRAEPGARAGRQRRAARRPPARRCRAAQLAEIRAAAVAWRDAHRRLRGLDDSGNYQAAVASAIGTDPTGSGVAFQRLDSTLGGVADNERRAFDDDLDAAGRRALRDLGRTRGAGADGGGGRGRRDRAPGR